MFIMKSCGKLINILFSTLVTKKPCCSRLATAKSIGPQAHAEEEEEEAKAGHLPLLLPSPLLDVSEHNEACKEAGQGAKAVSQHALVCLLSFKSVIKGRAKVYTDKKQDSGKLENTQEVSPAGIEALVATALKAAVIDDNGPVFLPVEDDGTDARDNEAVEASAGTDKLASVKTVEGEGAGDYAKKKKEGHPLRTVPHLHQKSNQHLKHENNKSAKN